MNARLKKRLAAKAAVVREHTAKVGQKVRELRGDRWTQADLAKRAGLSRLTVSYLENGKLGSIKQTTLQGLAYALGVSADDLMPRSTGGSR